MMGAVLGLPLYIPPVSIESVFLATVKRERLLPSGSAVTAAVSGGADSVAMLCLLQRFAPARRWKIQVLHIDHGLREGSGADAAFVLEICGQLGVSCRIERPEALSGGSMESRWSLARQKLYNETGTVVAVGHTMSDRAETLLLRLMEGSGLRGLGGMDYRGIGPVVRPLLDVTGTQAREYLKERHIPWREDPTNLDPTLARNRIRLSVMPALRAVFPHGEEGLSRSSAALSRWRDLQDVLTESAGNGMPRKEYLALPHVLRLAVLWAMAGKPRSGSDELGKTDSWLVSGGRGEHVLPGGLKLLADDEALAVHVRKGRYS
jgi:tRNA(Ile)-lysidine synthase